MSYATVDEVKSMFRNFTSTSNPAVTDAEITAFLDNTTAMIDAKIGTLYQMPITVGVNPESFKILKQIQMFKVACIIDDILNSYSEADKKPMWCKKAEALMKALVPPRENGCRQCEPTMKLPDAVYEGTDTQRNRISIGATTGTVFKKGADNW